MEPQTQPLVCKSHTAEFIGLFIVGVVIGLGLSFLFPKQAPAPVGTENTYQAGFDAAKKLVEESTLGNMMRTPDDIRTFSGTVTKVEGNNVTVHGQISMDPFADPALLDRTIIITNDTKIFKLSQKDMKTFQAEIDAFAKKTQKATSGNIPPILPPEAFIRTPSDIAGITAGSQINITAVENIKTMKEFSASEIQIQESLPPQIQPNMALPQ